MSTRIKLNFDNLALRALPISNDIDNFPRPVPGACFVSVNPTPVESPKLLIASSDAFRLLGIPSDLIDEADKQALCDALAGNSIVSGSQPAAHCYCGHQFGNFAGQLGDGAAIYLGEVVNADRERWEIQLKGAGPTPFSRQADGRKVLRSSLREFLCSEAMYHLGIPTTRAASVVTSDTMVARDVFYTGNVIMERASVTCRVAPTFIRFGSFDITKPIDPLTGRQGPSYGNHTILSQLADYVIQTFYPQIWSRKTELDLPSFYAEFFEEVVKRTANLVACWQTVGFCHGVLNTDNMSIVGLTIDYGPFGFLDRFDWNHVCNSSDTDGRYSYANQPRICSWNCARLAECLIRCLVDSLTSSSDEVTKKRLTQQVTDFAQRLQSILDSIYRHTFKATYLARMRAKLGLLFPSEESGTDEELIKSLLDTMDRTGADFTNTFLVLEELVEQASNQAPIDNKQSPSLSPDLLVNECCGVDELRSAYAPRDGDDLMEALRLMRSNREDSEDDDSDHVLSPNEKKQRFDELVSMSDSDKWMRDASIWSTWLTAYSHRLSIDCSNQQSWKQLIQRRLALMQSANPRIVLRNYLADHAIKAAEKGDFSIARKLLDALTHPFDRDSASIDELQRIVVDANCDRTIWLQAIRQRGFFKYVDI